MATANVNGITIGYDVIGDGEPMLLVMGLATQRIFWHDDFLKLIAAEGFQAIRMDNRDIGESTHFDTSPPPTRASWRRRSLYRRFATARRISSPIWPTTPPICSVTSASIGPTSSAYRWAA